MPGEAERRLDGERLALLLLVEAGAVLASSLDFTTTLGHVARLTIPRLADLCVIDLCDSEGAIGELAVAGVDDEVAAELEALRARYPLDRDGAHPVAKVIRSGRPELLPRMSRAELASYAQGDEHARFMVERNYSSAIVAPLQARGQTLGALSVLRLGDSVPYEENECGLVCELARRGALAIDNARLYSELQAVEQRLKAMFENVAEAITVVDAEGRTVFANPAAAELLRIEPPEQLTGRMPGDLMARFVVLDEAGRELGLEAMPGRRLFRGEQPEPLLVRNIVRATGEERWLNVRASPILEPGTGRILYAVNVLENITELKRAQLAEAFMAQASRVLASSLEYQEALRRLARMVSAQLAEWCAIDVVGEHGELELVALHHEDPQKLALVEQLRDAYRSAPTGAGMVGQVLAGGKGELLNDIDDDLLCEYARDEHHLKLLRALDIRDAIVVPLAAPTRTLGTITLLSSRGSRRLTEHDLDVATRLGRRSGTAVEAARLYTERTRIAHTLQRALLPDSLPHVQGFEIAAAYRAAGEFNEVGGDFYDVYPAGEGSWVAVIGDVCGKGAEAAAITALARHTLRAVAMYGEGPAGMLRALHRALLQQGDGQLMCTVCAVAFGRTDTNGQTNGQTPLTLALGGHPEPLLVDGAGGGTGVGEPGTVLGVVDPIAIAEVEVRLEPGATLVMYTDGVVEASTEARRSLLEQSRQAPLLGLTELLQTIERRAVESAAGRPRDDMALLALRLAGSSES